MKLVAESSQFQVYDDVLSAEDFNDVWKYMQTENYWAVHAAGWKKVWRLHDGTPLAGPPAYWYDKSTQDQALPSVVPSALVPVRFPTHSALDAVIKIILENESKFSLLIGKRPADWSVISAESYLYPSGTGLSWHLDQELYAGAYSLYVHPEWNVVWGGELLIADESCEGQSLSAGEITVVHRSGKVIQGMSKKPIHPVLDNSRENEVLSRIGMGRYVFAKPNRLVVLASGIPHMINRVSSGAGHRVRCSISGFFMRSPPKPGANGS